MKYSNPETAAKPANLLLIMADQLRFDVLSCAGHPMVRTPNLDRLAAEGAFFFNCNSHCPVCAPDRASILTGRGIEKTLMRTNEMLEHLPEDEGIGRLPTFDEILAEAGYTATFWGKFHVPGFKAACYRNGADVPFFHEHYCDYLDANLPRREPEDGEYLDRFTGRPYRPVPIDYHCLDEAMTAERRRRNRITQPDHHGHLCFDASHSVTAFQARQAIAAIEQAASGASRPFSITCSFHSPHAPMLPSPPFATLFDPQAVPLPPSLEDPMANNPYIHANNRPHLPEYRDPNLIRYMIANYYALVVEIDYWVGEILAALERNGFAEDTLVIFTSDHGEMLGDHGMREKNIFLEGSVHVPLLIRFPGRISPGSRITAPVSHLDLFPTILDYLGFAVPESDGLSLRSVIEGTTRRDYIVSEWNYANDGRRDDVPNFMVRTERWKYILCRNPEHDVVDCLFDLENDPHEMNNLIGRNPDRYAYRDIAEAMKQRLMDYLESTRHPLLAEVAACPAVK
ncbi:MAG: hypothetical protein D6820_16255 [Lentisphaerae bacterium]|nr:MAG: hypothetical protein D6820_16255 [Lentisphaerota bacterium]